MRKYNTLPKHKIDLQEAKNTQRCICTRCRTVFSDFHTRCPECGCHEWDFFQEENPYARMPLERFIQLCGHAFWLVGTILFLGLLWQTGSNDFEQNRFYIYTAIFALTAGVLISALYFALSEIIYRIMRIQRRLRAFHDHYRKRYPTLNTVKKKEVRQLKKVRTKAKKSIALTYRTRANMRVYD